MLVDLHVRNLAVLEEASVRLGPGFNVLSGETGAGKSIIVDALALLAGARADSELIRTGADSLTVTGRFVDPPPAVGQILQEAGLEDPGADLVVRRQVSRSGPNRVFLNDQPVTARLLGDLSAHLMRLHGQREELGLVVPDQQRRWLDHSAGAAGRELLAEVGDGYQTFEAARLRLERATGDERSRLERIDLLRLQLREIDGVDPVAGEEIELRQEREVLRHAEAILRGLSVTAEALSEAESSASQRVEEARVGLSGIRQWEPGAEEWLAELDSARIQLEDVAASVSRRLSEVELDPRRLDAVEERLAALERLLRRFGDSSEEILAYRQRIATELDELEVDAAGRQRLEAELAAARAGYDAAATRLTEARREWGEALSVRIEAELQDLALAKARFSVALERRGPEAAASAPSRHGDDVVTFQLAANPGEAARPLGKVASGGELARVYLALQLAVRGAGSASRATMVFDEVDSGIGGAQAAAVGRKLRRLASGGQILAVTHLPQVASCAHHHYRIRKAVEGGRTFVTVQSLDEPSRIEEVARMLAGEDLTEVSRSNARELIAAGAQG